MKLRYIIKVVNKQMAKRIVLTKEEYALATLGQDNPKPYSEYLKEMRMTKKDSVNKAAIKEMFDFLYDTITDISDESPEYYKSMSEEYDKIIEKILEA